MAARETGRCPPTLSEHASDRWDERARPVPDYHIDAIDAPDLWSAWVDAEPVQLPTPYDQAGDEARYHPDGCVVLCRRETAITTVYDLTGDDAHPRVRRAVEQQLGIRLEGSR